MKAVLFDVGNTLLWLDHAFVVGLLREHGVETTADALVAAEYDAKVALDRLLRSGRVAPEASRGRILFGEVFRILGVADEYVPSVTQRLYARHAERNLWCGVRERTHETLDELAGRGYRMGVVSNADGKVDRLLESLGLRRHFEVVVDSRAVGVEKPDPRIFRMALERMELDPGDAVYVGDVYEVDVLGARAAGMRAILLDPLARLGHLECERIAALHELPERLAEAA